MTATKTKPVKVQCPQCGYARIKWQACTKSTAEELRREKRRLRPWGEWGKKVVLRIDAPRDVNIRRGELEERDATGPVADAGH